MKKIFILFSAFVLINSCDSNEDFATTESVQAVESLKYVLPDGKGLMVTFNKETGVPVNDEDFEQFKDFVDENKKYAIFIDKFGNSNLVKNQDELTKKLKEEKQDDIKKGVIKINCSGYVKLISNTGATIKDFITTNQNKLVYASILSPNTQLKRTSSSNNLVFWTTYSMISGMYQGNISADTSISQTFQMKIENCYVDIVFKDSHKESTFPFSNVTDYYHHTMGTNYAFTISPSFYVDGRFASFANGNLLQLGYKGLCYQTS